MIAMVTASGPLFVHQAHVNVPALGERTMRRYIRSAEFTTGCEIQVIAVETVKIVHPITTKFDFWPSFNAIIVM